MCKYVHFFLYLFYFVPDVLLWSYRFCSLPINIQYANEGVLLGRGVQRHVDVLHDPVEHARVDMLGERVAGVVGLLVGHVLHVRLRGSGQLPVAQPVLHLLQLHAQEPAEVLQVRVVALRKRQKHTLTNQLPPCGGGGDPPSPIWHSHTEMWHESPSRSEQISMLPRWRMEPMILKMVTWLLSFIPENHRHFEPVGGGLTYFQDKKKSMHNSWEKRTLPLCVAIAISGHITFSDSRFRNWQP